ncbi:MULTISPECIES: helix-turn-helix transcriptional regulator [unclassified Sphingomonas]|uniref:helix-turn-helix transcriptional regulator n=1 Tax=unclassified Sphingomonas TaxID=196159 RepID=UPI002269AF50|nr:MULTISPECIES: helix-turn-helix transcriptional regulator [unclassified Sphingomonas]
MTVPMSAGPSWALSVLHCGMPEIQPSDSLALVWADSALAITRDADRSEMMAGDLMLVDRREPFRCSASVDDWSARMLDFGDRSLEQKVVRTTMALWRPLDGRSAMASAIRNTWLSIHDFRASGQRASEYQAMDLLTQTVVTLAQGTGDAPPSRYAMGLLGRAKAIVRTDLSNPDLGVQMIADRLGLSTRRVAAIFSAEYITPTAFITAERMKAAQAMLTDPLHPKRRIETIAWACGYRNHNHFCRVFKARHGVSPSTYRSAAQPD